MGLSPMARIEIGSWSVSAPSAAFERIFDIAFNYTSGLHENGQEVQRAECGFAASPVDSPQVVVDELDCQSAPGLAKQAQSRGYLSVGESYASSCEDCCALRSRLHGLGIPACRGWL